MPRIIRFNNTSNTNASEVAKRAQARAIYADALVAQKTLDKDCLNAVAAGPSAVASYSANKVTDQRVGAVFTTPAQQAEIIASSPCDVAQTVLPTPIPPIVSYSMSFSRNIGENGSHVSYPNDINLAIGTQDFTIEWFHYFSPPTPAYDFPRVFQIGNYAYSDLSIGFSFEPNPTFWIGMIPLQVQNSPPVENVWNYITIVGTGGTHIKYYVNGELIVEVDYPYNFTDNTTPLMIGNETDPAQNVNFDGYITNFRWVVGTAVYSGSSFPVPTTPLPGVPGTQLLLLATSENEVVKDSSPANRTPTNTGVTFINRQPLI